MSLLADLLSKIKQPPTTRDVPPNLKNIVQASAQKSAVRRRMVLLSVVFALAVMAGIFLVYFTRTLSDNQAGNISLTQLRKASIPERQIKDEAGKAAEPPAISRSAEIVQSVKPKETVQDKKVASPSVVPAKNKTDNLTPSITITGAKGRAVLPNLEQVIVTKGNTGKSQAKNTDESANDSYLYSAREMEMKNDYQAALANYKKVLETDKDNYMVLNNIAYIYLKQGLIKESINYSLKALEANKDYVPALINLGIAYAKSENIPAAEEYFNQALTLDPDNQGLLLNLAVLHERQLDYPRASEYFSMLSKAGNVSGTLGLARTLEKQGRTEEAVKLYKSVYADNSLDDKVRAEVRQRIIVLSGNIQN